MFIQYAFNPETFVFYITWIFVVVVSIVLHELGHGVAAIYEGDDTPIREKRMNGNPLVHMGMFSLICLAVVGIAWGMMPVNPNRFRHKYGDAIVSFAGPAVNLILAVIGLLITSIWIYVATKDSIIYSPEILIEGLKSGGLVPIELASDQPFLQNLFRLFMFFGLLNIILAIFNLIPIPPLDGSSILANFSPDYRRMISNPNGSQQIMFLVGFLFLFMIGFEYIFKVAVMATNYFIIGILTILP